ncbi:MAG TPA: hypothetical protein PKL31_17785 [Fulvivirga sp.]|nr:hypothetical protein [Fulvivirga sp.]
MKQLYNLLLLLLMLTPLFSQAQNGNYWAGTSAGNGNNNSVYNTTFVGIEAGNVNNANRNSFFGSIAGWKNTSGVENDFFGYESGMLNTTGSFNSFFGTYSGQQNVYGSYNSFFGHSSGHYSTSSKNSFFGYFSGYSTIGGENVFIGYASGRFTTSGNYNTFLGSTSGNKNTIGDNNTYIGYNSGANVYGYKNTFLGSQSGQNNNGSNNVFIGYQAGYNETGSNKLYIDNVNTPAPLIYGDFLSNALTINGTLKSTGNLETAGNFIVKEGGYLDDDATLGGNSDDWIKFSNSGTDQFLQVNSNNDDWGFRIRDKDGNGYLAITEVNNKAYFSENSASGNYFLSGNGRDATFGGKVITPRTGVSGVYNSNGVEVQGIWSIGSGYSIDEVNNDFGNLYGLGYAAPNSGQGVSGWKHQILFLNDGVMNASISSFNGNAYFKGDVGIGTTTPSQKLDVNGSAFVDTSVILGNKEKSNTTGTTGEIYFDQNYYQDFPELNGNGGGLAVYNEDGWGAIMATNNSQWMTPTFDGGIFNSRVDFNGGAKINGDLRGGLSGGAIRIQTDFGYTEIGSKSSPWSGFYTDRSRFYFNKGITVNEGLIGSLDEDLQLQTEGTTRMTISNTDGDVSINNNLLVGGTIQFDASALTEDNSQDDLMVIRQDGSMATRSVESIESPWMFAEFFNGLDTISMICPDSSMLRNIVIDVIDLNGNIRIGDNAYIDDDLEYGGLNDDWIRFDDGIEFMSSADKKGIVLYDQNTFLDYTNFYHEAGSTYMSNNSDADNYFLKSTGRNVEFGGNVLIPSLSGTDNFSVSSNNTLYLSMDADNDSESASESNAISFGTNGQGTDPNYNEIMRIEETGNIFMNNLPLSTTLENMMVVDGNNQIHYRDVNTLKLSPWDESGTNISFTGGKVGIGTTTIPSAYMLAVDGRVLVEELKVELSEAWPDYVFEDNYNLMPLAVLKKFVKEEKHLPNVPTQASVEEEGGINVGEMNRKLLEKVEELTLYLIKENERVSAIEVELKKLKTENEELRAQNRN